MAEARQVTGMRVNVRSRWTGRPTANGRGARGQLRFGPEASRRSGARDASGRRHDTAEAVVDIAGDVLPRGFMRQPPRANRRVL